MNQQNFPTWDARSENRTRAALVGGECSHHCAIPAPGIDGNPLATYLMPQKKTTFLGNPKMCEKADRYLSFRYVITIRNRDKIFLKTLRKFLKNDDVSTLS